MPEHVSHRYVTTLLLGKPYSEVHRAIDRPYLIYGRKHRRIFHTPLEVFIIGTLASPDPGGGLAGLFHLWLDEKCSKDKDFKKWIKFMAKRDAHGRWMMRQWKRLLKKRCR